MRARTVVDMSASFSLVSGHGVARRRMPCARLPAWRTGARGATGFPVGLVARWVGHCLSAACPAVRARAYQGLLDLLLSARLPGGEALS